MARNPDIAQVPTSPNVTARLEWEKKDEHGVLVFSDSRYEPISVEVEELKGTHQPIIRIIYYRGGNDYARYVKVAATVNTPTYKELLPVMPPEPVDDTVYQCRINLRFGRNTPICI